MQPLETNGRAPSPLSRRGLIGKALIAGVAATPVIGAFASTAQAAPNVLDNASREAFRSIRFHENEHVSVIRSALGSAARPKPTFKNLEAPNFAAFVTLSGALENVGCGAYLAATPAISSKAVLATAASIALIEARHAGFLNVFQGKEVTLGASRSSPVSFEKPLTIDQVVAAASPYIASLNGGPAPTFKSGDDVSILNFALLLEYLEAEYYNINVPKFIK